MGSTRGHAALQQSLAALSKVGVKVPAGAAPNWLGSAWARSLREFAVATIPTFGDSASPQPIADFERHASEHVRELARLVEGATVPDFGFVRTYAYECVVQGLPIDAILQALRYLQPMLSEWACRTVAPPRARSRNRARAVLAQVVTEYVGAAGIEFAAAYVAQTSVVAEAQGDRRTELLSILVSGYDEADARVARLLKRSGYLEQRLSFCVALAQSTDPLEMESPSRAQRIADALIECVAPLRVRALVGIRTNLVTAVYSEIRRVSGWTAPRASLAEQVEGQLRGLGPSVLIGLSGNQASNRLIPRGLHEAMVALDFASVTERVVTFPSLSIRGLLIHRGAADVQHALPAWFGRLRDADAGLHGSLVKTLRAIADTDMNIQGAARRLRVHPNTVYARIQRIKDLTGLEALGFHDLSNLLLAIDCARN
jgi:hypothetical protein